MFVVKQIWYSSHKNSSLNMLIYGEDETGVTMIRYQRMLQKKHRGLINGLASLNKLLIRSNIANWAELIQKPWRILWLNFLAGLARGFGIAVGLTLVTGIFLVFLTRLANMNLPVIGRFIAEIVQLVNDQLQIIPR